jgi:hypothetical protein
MENQESSAPQEANHSHISKNEAIVTVSIITLCLLAHK